MSELVPSTYTAMPHMPLVLHQDKFVEASRLFGYRVIHIPYDPCPEGSTGCPLCRGARVGFHRREPQTTPVQDVIRYAHAMKLPEALSHRFRTSPIVLTAPVGGVMTELAEGVDFTVVDGRRIQWLPDGRRPDYQKQYTVSYDAIAESWVHMQHAYGDFGGMKRQSEKDKLLKSGIMPQGSLLMSINHDNPGYELMQGDVFVAVDGSIRTVRHIKAGRPNNQSMHRFIHQIEKAYAVDAEQRQEYDVRVEYDPATLSFNILDDLPDDTSVAVVYRAAPQYTVYLDIGEFRHPLGQDHQRLVILVKMETTV